MRSSPAWWSPFFSDSRSASCTCSHLRCDSVRDRLRLRSPRAGCALLVPLAICVLVSRCGVRNCGSAAAIRANSKDARRASTCVNARRWNPPLPQTHVPQHVCAVVRLRGELKISRTPTSLRTPPFSPHSIAQVTWTPRSRQCAYCRTSQRTQRTLKFLRMDTRRVTTPSVSRRSQLSRHGNR